MMETEQGLRTLSEALRSPVYVTVRRRVFRQLVESLLYEGVVTADTAEEAGHTRFTLHGRDADGRPVAYQCGGRRSLTFGRIRLTDEPVRRLAGDREEEAASLAGFVEEVLGPLQGFSPEKLRSFVGEMEGTLLNDTLAQYRRTQSWNLLRGKAYDDLEGDAMDGHPYHPAYKSRVGFDYADQLAYGPEFKPSLQLQWVAVRRDCTRVAVSPGENYDDLIAAELGAPQLESFRAELRKQGYAPEAYVFLPVHPWQWRRHTAGRFFRDIRDGRIVSLGTAGDLYVPQQSIRTLSNRTNPRKAYAKLSMDLINTSSSRELLPHFVVTAPPITGWLKGIAASDPYLREETKLILLGEFAGVSYDPPHEAGDGSRSGGSAGSLGCIWRESVHRYLEPGEEAVPFHALCSRELDGSLFIAPWLESIGVESWLRRLFKTCVLPVVHLAVAHGIALESHAQNMVLVHRGGMPVRAALKDFHEDVLYTRDFLREPERCPDFPAVHEIYRHGGPGTSFEAGSLSTVRGLTLGALFFINLGELALTLADRYGYEESRFWTLAADLLESYRIRFPQYEERFRTLDLFVPETRVEQLTKRRLVPAEERGGCSHDVPNPLYHVREREITGGELQTVGV
ncbi:IucA/IucC family protein [Paenibacillus sp. S-38]|uniref:IucA/IucC family protein n=1 Tax=Paenibacillus sp. S-38 TaxID=3416710 RepID=UPI003CF53559